MTFDVLMLLVNNWIFILFPRFPGPLFALPYCHQFLAPIKTILSWHHKITFFCRWTFTKSFGTKQAQIIFGLLFTPGQRCCGIYQSTPTIRKHDMFSQPLQRSNVLIEFHHFLVQGRLFRVFRLWEVGAWAEKQVEDRWGWIFKVHKFWLPCKSDLNVPLIGWRVGIAGEICDQFKLHGESDCPPSQHTYVGNTTPETADLLVDTHYLCSYQSLAIKWPYLRFSLIQLTIRGRAC